MRLSVVAACQAPDHGGSVEGDSVELWARDGWGGEQVAGPGQDPSAQAPAEVPSAGTGKGGNSGATVPESGDDIPALPEVGCADGSACEVELPETVNDDPVPVVQISDLVNFRPVVPVAAMQPAGWMLVGLDTNFIATAGEHVLTGELLGLPAQVRFTPYRYHWSYGDGTSTTTATAGATWARLGVPEFSRTVTSHRYRERGEYTIGLTVEYIAEYRFAGGGWTGISGTVASVAADLTARAGQIKTVLVPADCLTEPGGVGC